jgi:hypothetical protein
MQRVGVFFWTQQCININGRSIDVYSQQRLVHEFQQRNGRLYSPSDTRLLPIDSDAVRRRQA